MLLIKNGRIFQNATFKKADILIDEDHIVDIQKAIECSNVEIIDASDCIVVPGLQDAHVHLREPGFTYKETIKEGSECALRGGYTMIAAMPNLNPVPDSLDHLQVELECIRKDAVNDVIPYASISKGEQGKELSDMEDVAEYVIGYSDDGKGVNDPKLLKKAMELAVKLHKPIVLHCEDLDLVDGGYVADTPHLLAQGYKGVCAESEAKPIREAIELAKETGCHVHICHISCRESLEAIREGKRNGIHVTCEVTPHHLLLNDYDVLDDGNFKMNPPLRSEEDRLALIEGLNDGSIDLIATDNAPHSEEEKSRGLKDSPFGIITNEYALALLYTHLVETGLISLETLLRKMTAAKEVLIGIPTKLEVNEVADLCICRLGIKDRIQTLHSKSKNSPFVGWDIHAENQMTIYKGKIAYRKEM